MNNNLEAVALLPCPFCGSVGDKVFVADNTGPKLCTNAHAFVRCIGCHTDGPEAETVEAAIAAWNQRAAINALPDIGGLVEALTECVAAREQWLESRPNDEEAAAERMDDAHANAVAVLAQHRAALERQQ